MAPKPESCSRCSDAGVLGVIPGIIGSLQALECIKILAGVGQVAARKLVIFDGLAMRFHTVKLRARSVAQNTPICLVETSHVFDLLSLNAVRITKLLPHRGYTVTGHCIGCAAHLLARKLTREVFTTNT